MEKEKDCKKGIWYYKEIIIIGGVILVFIILAYIFYLDIIKYFGYDIKENETGKLGDTFGALTCLFTGLAFEGVIITILLQRKELVLQRKELKDTRSVFEKQLFENTFFNMLEFQSKIVNNFKLSSLKTTSPKSKLNFLNLYNNIKAIYQNNKLNDFSEFLKIIDNIIIYFKNRNTKISINISKILIEFQTKIIKILIRLNENNYQIIENKIKEIWIETKENLYINNSFLKNNNNFQKFDSIVLKFKIEDINYSSEQIIIKVFKYIINENKDSLMKYFTNLYVIITYIDMCNFIDKDFYFDILKAQFTTYELIIIYYYSISFSESKFDLYNEKYNILSELDEEYLIHINDIINEFDFMLI